MTYLARGSLRFFGLGGFNCLGLQNLTELALVSKGIFRIHPVLRLGTYISSAAFIRASTSGKSTNSCTLSNNIGTLSSRSWQCKACPILPPRKSVMRGRDVVASASEGVARKGSWCPLRCRPRRPTPAARPGSGRHPAPARAAGDSSRGRRSPRVRPRPGRGP